MTHKALIKRLETACYGLDPIDPIRLLVDDVIEALAQPEQEPVAVKHMMEWVDYLKRKSDYGKHLQIPSEMSAGACWDLARELEQFITAPPQRSESSGKPSAWVELTNEELTDLFYNTNLGQHSAVAQAIALLKEKNA